MSREVYDCDQCGGIHEDGYRCDSWRGRTCGECAWALFYGDIDQYYECRNGQWQTHRQDYSTDDPACPAFVPREEQQP